MRALVTGVGGFLGAAIVTRLLGEGIAVRSFTRSDHPELRRAGVEVVRGDLADAARVEAAASGCAIVYHVAAKAGYWGPRAEYVRANVDGTENVLGACRTHGIDRLVYTSTPSVVYDGGDIENGNESLPYPSRYEAAYAETKALAEQKVLAANGPELATVSLRPHLIWGPRDNQLVPRLVARAEAGTLLKIGRGGQLVDTVYIDNAADAHLLAGKRLAPGSPIAGKVYFISNGEPLPVDDLIDRVIGAAGHPPVLRRIPTALARLLAAAAETLHPLLRRAGEPRLTRFLVSQLSTAHWFDIGAARRDLGYAPAVSIDEGMERLAEWYREERAE